MAISPGSSTPTYSASQLGAMGACSLAYKYKYVDKLDTGRKTEAAYLGTVTGAAIQALVVATDGQTITPSQALTAYQQAFVEVFKEMMPLHLVDACVALLEDRGSYELLGEDGNYEAVTPKTYVGWLDLQFLAIKDTLSWEYRPLSKRAGARFLEQITYYPGCVYNGYMTLQQAGLFMNLDSVTPENKITTQGKTFAITGLDDLLLTYTNGNVVVVELKTSSSDTRKKLPEASSCHHTAKYVTRSAQANTYAYLAKKKYGAKFAGLYWVNTSFQKHIIKMDIEEDYQVNLITQYKNLHLVREQALYAPVCGTQSRNTAAAMCDFSSSCPYA